VEEWQENVRVEGQGGDYEGGDLTDLAGKGLRVGQIGDECGIAYSTAFFSSSMPTRTTKLPVRSRVLALAV
jgi:hypothetical protein